MNGITYKGIMNAAYAATEWLVIAGILACLAAFPIYHVGLVKIGETLAGGFFVALAAVPAGLVFGEVSK